MKQSFFLSAAAIVVALTSSASGHDPNGAPMTWNREISRIVYERCASCHRDGGTAFSLMTYQEAQPKAAAIKEAVLSRRMPPWGAVKGFGAFRNDRGLTQQQIELVAEWVEAGTQKGNNPKALPPVPTFEKAAPFTRPPAAVAVNDGFTLSRPIIVDGLYPQHVPAHATMKIVAALPNGAVEPLVWLYEFNDSYRHPFLFRKPLSLPAGTVIRGVAQQSRILLLPAEGKAAK